MSKDIVAEMNGMVEICKMVNTYGIQSRIPSYGILVEVPVIPETALAVKRALAKFENVKKTYGGVYDEYAKVLVQHNGYRAEATCSHNKADGYMLIECQDFFLATGITCKAPLPATKKV